MIEAKDKYFEVPTKREEKEIKQDEIKTSEKITDEIQSTIKKLEKILSKPRSKVTVYVKKQN